MTPSAHTHPHSHPTIHSHAPSLRLGLALGITLAFVIVEVIAGRAANSLALISDAGHNLTDVLALAIAWFALRLSLRPANPRRTYGYPRAGILAALVNATTLALMAGWIFYEAYQRWLNPPDVKPNILIIVGAIAVVVNLATAMLIHRDSQHDLNMRAAFLHMMGDVFSTIGATVAGVLILFTGWNWLDPLVSVLIGGLILWNAWGILRETTDILLESTPRDVNLQAMVDDILKVDGVREVHELHVWSLDQAMRSLSAHVITDDQSISSAAEIQDAIAHLLAERYAIGHTTLQLECAECRSSQVECGMRG